MNAIHHKPIKKFSLEGSILDDSLVYRLKNEYIRLLGIEMKLLGYSPRLDIDPDFTISYNDISKGFDFILTVYGVFVGKKKSEWILGVDGTQVVPIQKSKLKEYSLPLE